MGQEVHSLGCNMLLLDEFALASCGSKEKHIGKHRGKRLKIQIHFLWGVPGV